MTWIRESPLSWVHTLAINIIKCGPIPKHIGFIMDGNRRYAQKAHVEKSVGHLRGFDKLSETLQWCRHLGVNEVTVYAFSIENFKRPSNEVDTLIDIAREKFALLLNEKDKLAENGVRIRVIGNLSLLPPDLRKMFAEVMLMTKDNNSVFLNVAFAYTAREEISNAVNFCVNSVKNGAISADDIDETLISQCLYTNQSPEPDLLVRTSGEVRFSDFLLWQISNTFVYFTKVLWPEFNLWHLLYGVFLYQRSYASLQKVKEEKMKISNLNYSSSDRSALLKLLEEQRLEQLYEYVNYC